MRNKILSAFMPLLAVSSLLSTSDLLAEHITIGAPDFPPYYQKSSRGTLSGELTRLFSDIATQAGYSWSGTIVPAQRVMHELLNGRFNSSILVENPMLDHAPNLLKSPYPVSEITLNVYYPTLKNSSDKGAVFDRGQLKNSKVAVMRGYGYGGLRKWLNQPEQGITVIEIDHFSSAVRLLENQRVHYALLYDVNFIAALKQLKRPARDISSTLLSELPLYLYLYLNTQDFPTPVETMDRLMQSHRQLSQQGSLSDR